jgi:hypothetical protein
VGSAAGRRESSCIVRLVPRAVVEYKPRGRRGLERRGSIVPLRRRGRQWAQALERGSQLSPLSKSRTRNIRMRLNFKIFGDRAVGIETDCWLDGRGLGFRVPVKVTCFSSSSIPVFVARSNRPERDADHLHMKLKPRMRTRSTR